MNDMLNDDDIIARLRSALDEVAATGTADGGNDAATGDSDDIAVVPIRTTGPVRRSRRTWLSVAAASAVLLGAGGWALSLRSSAPTGVQATTPSLETTTPGDVTSTASTYDPSYPWFELRLPDAEAGGIVTDSTSGPSDTGTQVWLVTKPGGGGRNRGLLSVEVHYNRLDLLPDMTGYTEVSGAPQGTAWLRNDLSAGAAGPQLVWQRDDAVWWVTEVGLIDPAAGGGAAFANSVFRIEKGTFNDLLNNPDPQSEWWGSLSSNTRTTHTEAYTIGGTPRGAVLSVTNTAVLNTLAGFTDFTEVGVAGSRGFLGTLPDGTSAAVWPAAPTWWATLRINPALASRTSEILAAVTSANSVALPTTASTIAVDSTLPVKPADAPSYTLNDPSFTVEGTNGVLDLGAGTRPQSVVWSIEQTDPNASPAYMFATAFDWGGMPYEADGVTYRDVSRNGVKAVLYVGDLAATPPSDPVVYFPQADGVVWAFEAANLVARANDPYGALVDMAFSLSSDAFTSSANSPVVAGVTVFGKGTPARLQYDDTYRTPTGGTIKLTVHDGFAPAVLRDATQVTPTTVLGRPALVGTFADGSTQVVWQAADGSRWWVSLGFSDAATAAQADKVIASLEPVSVTR